MHDGSQLYLRKLEEDYDATDKIRAITRLNEAHKKGEVLTGIFYVNPEAPSFIDMLNVVDATAGHAAGFGNAPRQGSARRGDGRAAVASGGSLLIRSAGGCSAGALSDASMRNLAPKVGRINAPTALIVPQVVPSWCDFACERSLPRKTRKKTAWIIARFGVFCRY